MNNKYEQLITNNERLGQSFLGFWVRDYIFWNRPKLFDRFTTQESCADTLVPLYFKRSLLFPHYIS